MAAPTISSLTYGGESYGNGSYVHTPGGNQVGHIVCYNREEQYSDFETVKYGGLSMTRQQVQSGGGAILASALWTLLDLSGKASESVSWVSGYGGNHKWACDINCSGPVTVVASGKTTLASWENYLSVTLDPGSVDCVALLLLHSNQSGDYVPQAVNGTAMTQLAAGEAGGKYGIFTVPVLAGAGPSALRVWVAWPGANSSMLAMLIGGVPSARKRNQAIVVM